MLRRLAWLELAACVALLAAITGLVFVAAVMRFFGSPITWSVDMAQLLFIWLCMLGANRAMREKSHLGMEMVAKYLPQRARLWLELVCGAIVVVFLVILVREGTYLTLLNKERQFGDSTLSYAWVTAAVPVGCALLAASVIYNMVDAWRRRREGTLVYTRTAADPGLDGAPLEL
jgi:TRAP-type C4-dicarboxylate transport system permease small subunit